MTSKRMHMCSYADMGWLQLVGSLKLQVSFVKQPYKRDDIPQKRPVILRSLLIVATPYQKSSGMRTFWYVDIQKDIVETVGSIPIDIHQVFRG